LALAFFFPIERTVPVHSEIPAKAGVTGELRDYEGMERDATGGKTGVTGELRNCVSLFKKTGLLYLPEILHLKLKI
jgi:hypothetical protein